jgi:hypothetical protein
MSLNLDNETKYFKLNESTQQNNKNFIKLIEFDNTQTSIQNKENGTDKKIPIKHVNKFLTIMSVTKEEFDDHAEDDISKNPKKKAKRDENNMESQASNDKRQENFTEGEYDLKFRMSDNQDIINSDKNDIFKLAKDGDYTELDAKGN